MNSKFAYVLGASGAIAGITGLVSNYWYRQEMRRYKQSDPPLVHKMAEEVGKTMVGVGGYLNWITRARLKGEPMPTAQEIEEDVFNRLKQKNLELDEAKGQIPLYAYAELKTGLDLAGSMFRQAQRLKFPIPVTAVFAGGLMEGARIGAEETRYVPKNRAFQHALIAGGVAAAGGTAVLLALEARKQRKEASFYEGNKHLERFIHSQSRRIETRIPVAEG